MCQNVNDHFNVGLGNDLTLSFFPGSLVGGFAERWVH